MAQQSHGRGYVGQSSFESKLGSSTHVDPSSIPSRDELNNYLASLTDFVDNWSPTSVQFKSVHDLILKSPSLSRYRSSTPISSKSREMKIKKQKKRDSQTPPLSPLVAMAPSPLKMDYPDIHQKNQSNTGLPWKSHSGQNSPVILDSSKYLSKPILSEDSESDTHSFTLISNHNDTDSDSSSMDHSSSSSGHSDDSTHKMDARQGLDKDGTGNQDPF